MKKRHITFAALCNDSVDTENAVILGVSVITSGLVARGHDLAVDAVTLEQVLSAAETKGQVPVKVNHKSGAEAVCGYLDGFRLEGKKIKADWHLLQTHPQTPQILEIAERMPSGVGLSASFLAPAKTEKGKARCEELLSVDYVTLPAANPDGLFSARYPDREDPAAARRKAALAKVAGVLGAGAVGAVGGAGIASQAMQLAKSSGIHSLRPSIKVRAGILGAAGALGAVSAARAALPSRRRREDDRRDFAAALVSLGFSRGETLRQANTLAREPDPIAPRVVILKPARRTLGKCIAIRAAKIAVGAAGGAYIGRKLGTAAGAATGAAAGLLFQAKARPVSAILLHSTAARNAARAGLTFAARVKILSA